MSKRIIRVFPRKTKATPCDDLAAVNRLPYLFDEADEIHISVAFTWDLPTAENLAKVWRYVAPVSIGGPATGQRGEAFVAGQYLHNGYTITSRGCPNKCWFCSVWKREGNIREFPICDGWNVLDDNLLACSDAHIKSVFDMLSKQSRKNPPQFTGGLEAKRLKSWHCKALKEQVRPAQMFFAYDTPDDLEPLQQAGVMLFDHGFKRFRDGGRELRCYVLIGWKGDTIEKAELRIREAADAGFIPMAMAIRDEQGKISNEWRKFQRQWVRMEIIQTLLRL